VLGIESRKNRGKKEEAIKGKSVWISPDFQEPRGRRTDEKGGGTCQGYLILGVGKMGKAKGDSSKKKGEEKSKNG